MTDLEVQELRAENAALRELAELYRTASLKGDADVIALRAALDAQMQYQRNLRNDRDRLDWQARHCVFLAVETSPDGYERISPTRQGIDRARERQEAQP